MSYQGRANTKYEEKFFQETIFPFLKKALMNFDEKIPFRGPKEFIDENLRYTFDMQGDYDYFKGKETVFYNDDIVFTQDVMGGLIK
jgi:hypothetical protein